MAAGLMSDSGFDAAAVLRAMGAEEAYALICGYPFTAFGRVRKGGLELPPGFPVPADFSGFHDIRVFCSHREWHAWRTTEGWNERLAPEDNVDELTQPLHLALWGTRTAQDSAGWALLTEDTGAQVWAPAEVVQGRTLPLGLRLVRRVEYDKYGVAYISDARITGFEEHPCVTELKTAQKKKA